MTDLEDLILAAIETFDDVAETYRIWRAMPADRMAEVIAARLEAAGVTAPRSDPAAPLLEALVFIADWAHDCASPEDTAAGYGFVDIERMARAALATPAPKEDPL